MNDFIVSARKYRPETFKSVVGQESITVTLRNAIKNNHLGHAYLFCGPRGVGKTTCARIFAKILNCSSPTSDAEPCNDCESCKAFNDSRSYNIHELDAASNNSVDDIRTLTERVRIPPQIGKYSVYIIDEVHMLSQQAFNAFLKTLEEPPAHAVFILATTEKHKIIPTILSRCQIFDFNRIKVDDAVKYLAYIAGNEKMEFEEDALHMIAQKADGAMRDALSIFDQIVSFSGKNITYQDVIDNLNILDYEYYFRITENILQADISDTLLIFDEILEKGFDGHNFITGLATHLRDLLVSTDPATVKLLEVSDSLRQRYMEQAKKCSAGFLFEALDICNQADLQYKSSRNPRLLIELSLVKLSNLLGEKKNSDIKETVDITSSTGAESQKIANKKEIEKEPEPVKPEPEIKKETSQLSENSSSRDIHKKNVIKNEGISIKDALAGSGKEKTEQEDNYVQDPAKHPVNEIEEDVEVQDEDFGSEEMMSCWTRYANQLKEDKPRIFTTLISRKPLLHDDYSIEIEFDNTSQLEDFKNNIKQNLLSFMRSELGNKKISFHTFLAESDNGKKKLYTAEDKYSYLSKKNPALGKLKKDFNLDFD